MTHPLAGTLLDDSGTEDVYKIYAESLRDEAHLEQIPIEARAAVGRAIQTAQVSA